MYIDFSQLYFKNGICTDIAYLSTLNSTDNSFFYKKNVKRFLFNYYCKIVIIKEKTNQHEL